MRSRRRSRRLSWATVTLTAAALTATACAPAARPSFEPEIDPTPTAASPVPAGSNAPADAEPSFTVVASGDILLHTPLVQQAAADAKVSGAGPYDFDAILHGIEPVVSGADLAICHLETPLAPPGGPFSSYPTFSVPPQVVDTIADLGYDTCSTASNHSLDKGLVGVRRTLDDLDGAGIRHAGSARSAAEAARPTILEVRGVKVAQLSYSFGFNGIEVPAAAPWSVNTIDRNRILTDARRARAAGAKVVIVSLHWGVEYQHAPTAEQRTLARQLLSDPSIDLIVGHHAHVTQPFEQINGKWVVYGLGNLVARHDQPKGSTEEGMFARFRFTRDSAGHWSVTRAEYVPTYIDLGPPIRVVDLPAALADRTLPSAKRTRYARAELDTDTVVGSLGATTSGLTRSTS